MKTLTVDQRKTRQIAAVKTLMQLGYTWDGGEQWSPPKPGAVDFVARAVGHLQDLQASLRCVGADIEIAAVTIKGGQLTGFQSLKVALANSSAMSSSVAMQWGYTHDPAFELAGVKFKPELP